jgi:hypothetical protein
MTLSFIPGIQAGKPLKSLMQRQTRSIGALITVLTSAFAISVPFGAPPLRGVDAAQISVVDMSTGEVAQRGDGNGMTLF